MTAEQKTETVHTCSYECERPGCIRAQRDELVARLTAAMSQPAEAQAQGGGEVVQRLRGVLEHGKMGDKCLIAPDLVTAAIAALSAQQPAAVDWACAAAAIQFSPNDPEGMTFLRLWNEGEFDTLRREWPDAPSEVYIGADPLATQHQEPTT